MGQVQVKKISSYKNREKRGFSAGQYSLGFGSSCEKKVQGTLPLQFQHLMKQTEPLPGVNIDLQNIQDYIHGITIKRSTKNQDNCLMTKQEILDDFKKECSFFFYTGHGSPNGNLVIETKSNRDGEQITPKDLFSDGKRKGFVVIDSCFSGKFLMNSLQQNPNVGKIYVASGENNKSYDYKGIGGVLIFLFTFCPIDEKGRNFQTYMIQRLIQQKGMMYERGGKPRELSEQQWRWQFRF